MTESLAPRNLREAIWRNWYGGEIDVDLGASFVAVSRRRRARRLRRSLARRNWRQVLLHVVYLVSLRRHQPAWALGGEPYKLGRGPTGYEYPAPALSPVREVRP